MKLIFSPLAPTFGTFRDLRTGDAELTIVRSLHGNMNHEGHF